MATKSNTSREMLHEAYQLMSTLKSILKAGNNITPEMLPILQCGLENIDGAITKLDESTRYIGALAIDIKAHAECLIEDNPDEYEVKDWQMIEHKAKEIFETSQKIFD